MKYLAKAKVLIALLPFFLIPIVNSQSATINISTSGIMVNNGTGFSELHVNGTQLLDESDNPVFLVGANTRGHAMTIAEGGDNW